MARIPSRKVARAAKMGGGRRRNTSSSLGWYASLLAIVLVGSGFVAFSRAEHLDEANPGSTPPLAPSADGRAGDRWIESIGFYTCDKFAPNLNPSDDPYGITTKNDGFILVAPNAKKYAGRNATVGLFAKASGLQLSRDSFQLPGDQTKYGPGAKCGERNGKLVIREWENASDTNTGKKVEGNPQSILLKDKAALTIAWVPDDYDENTLPIPPSAAGIEARVAQETAAQQADGSAATQPQDLQTAPSTAPAEQAPATTAAPAPQ